MKNNLKRIAIILPVIALLLAFFAVPAAADYSPETGWSEPIIIPDIPVWVSDGSSTNVDSNYEAYIYSEYRVLSFPDYLVEGVSVPNLDIPDGEYYFLTASMYSFTSSDYSVYFPNQQYLGMLSRVFSESFQVGINVSTVEGVKKIVLIVNDGGNPSGFVPLVSSMQNLLGDGYRFLVGYVGDYPPSADLVDLDVLSMLSFEYVTALASSPTEPIGNVWTGIMTWITSALTTVMGAFYVDGSLTLLGTLACIGVSVGIGFLLIGLIQRFLKLRG